MVRVGSVAQVAPSGAATPRSLAAGEGASAGSGGGPLGADDDPTLERRELKRMHYLMHSGTVRHGRRVTDRKAG